MEQFLRALEKVETAMGPKVKQPGGLCLSTLMRDSRRTRRFWFDYAARKGFDVDTIFWTALHNDGAGIELLDDELRAEMEPFTRVKMEQLKASKEDCAARFSLGMLQCLILQRIIFLPFLKKSCILIQV